MKNSINRALDFLATKVEESIDDTYALALTCYVLHLAKHPHRDTVFYQLEGKAEVNGNQKWWEIGKWEKTAETSTFSRPIDVETTSYVLQTYALRSLAKDAVPVLSWLAAQRNQAGGFQSTQVRRVYENVFSIVPNFFDSNNSVPSIQFGKVRYSLLNYKTIPNPK